MKKMITLSLALILSCSLHAADEFSKETGKELLEPYAQEFDELFEHCDRNKYNREKEFDTDRYHFEHEAIIAKLKKDEPVNKLKLNFDNDPNRTVHDSMMGFMQTKKEIDEAIEVAEQYNAVHGFSETDERRVTPSYIARYKQGCYFDKVYGNPLQKITDNTPADLIAVREECHTKFNDYVQALKVAIANKKV